MRLGLMLGYWGLGLTAEDQRALLLEAESAGFDSVWTAEAYGSDAATPLAWFAAQTERIKLGAAILHIPGRSPAMTAMTAVTLDHLSNGRFLLGLGTSGPQVAEGWHGQRFGKQLARTREYVEIVRKALARERLTYEGDTYTLPLPDGPGKALKLMLAPVQEQIPVYIAAIGPKNTQLAASRRRLAAGLLLARHVGTTRARCWRRARRAPAARSTSFDTPRPCMSRSTTTYRARDACGRSCALYVGGMGSREKNFYNALVRRYGFEDAAQEISGPVPGRQKEEAAAAIPAELIDTVTICGPRDRVKDRLSLRAAPASAPSSSPHVIRTGAAQANDPQLAEML